MYHYWFTTAIVVGAIIFTFQLVCTVIVIAALYIWWHYSGSVAPATTSPTRRPDIRKSLLNDFEETAKKHNEDFDDKVSDSSVADVLSLIHPISGSSSSIRRNSSDNINSGIDIDDVSNDPSPDEGIRHRNPTLDDDIQRT